MKPIPCFLSITLALLLLPACFTGCATSGGAPKYIQPLRDDARVVASDTVKSEVTPSAEVLMAKYEQERLAQLIDAATRAHAPAGKRTPRNYVISVRVTQYEKGNAFARAMLAGLGQMHLDGVIAVYQLPGRTKVGEFTISKTFSWGGIYGASTTIETVEEEFAKAVAKAVVAAGAE